MFSGGVQVVWHAMQEEFIRQYKYIEDLLQVRIKLYNY